MKLRTLSVLRPTTAVLIILATLATAQNFCWDHPNPLKPRKRVAVDCLSGSPAAPPAAKRTVERRDQLSYNGSDYFQIDFTCGADSALCLKARNAFKKAGEIISGVVLFSEPINVNASFFHFCQQINDCGNNNFITLVPSAPPLPCPPSVLRNFLSPWNFLYFHVANMYLEVYIDLHHFHFQHEESHYLLLYIGGSYPARTVPIQDSDGIGRFYPQGLVKQLNLKNPPKYGLYDITSMFNADAPFYFTEDGQITNTQSDFLFVILHEFMHGLGFYSNWNDYINQVPQALTPDVTPLDTGDPTVNINPYAQMTFAGFYESVFDRYMVTLPDLTYTSQITRALNAFNGGIGTKYAGFDVFFSYLVKSPQYQKAQQMYKTSVTAYDLGFLPANGTTFQDAIILETSLNPFSEGSSISHVDYRHYTNTSDFLMRYMQDRGVTLQDAVTRGGGGPIGPRLLQVLESLGYATINNPNPSRNVTTVPYSTSSATALRLTALETWGKLGVALGVVAVLGGWF
ncbi:hypothetical protein BC936DRAFT_142097 [Jimgerdemannia flammicorona]|uniref:Sequence orphan n=1 Tax=Jimgerdemannia flammicorona TaxID=994334 RepID=A0A433A135_9FUNG|nr:hypothetical protein BC936DRAFT_142097 [Jimgerdemannia flammicorona]